MKTCRILTVLLLAFMPVATIMAEGIPGSFGYLDFNATMKMMPDYLEAQLRMQQIQSEFDDEIDNTDLFIPENLHKYCL